MKNQKIWIGVLIVLVILSFIKVPDCYTPVEQISSRSPVVEDVAVRQDTLKQERALGSYVLGDSMYPTIKSNQICTCKVQRDYDIGDIVSYYSYAYDPNVIFILHRIVDKNDAGFLTKGDNNNFIDIAEVSKEQVFCKIEEVNLLTKMFGGRK